MIWLTYPELAALETTERLYPLSDLADSPDEFERLSDLLASFSSQETLRLRSSRAWLGWGSQSDHAHLELVLARLRRHKAGLPSPDHGEHLIDNRPGTANVWHALRQPSSFAARQLSLQDLLTELSRQTGIQVYCADIKDSLFDDRVSFPPSLAPLGDRLQAALDECRCREGAMGFWVSGDAIVVTANCHLSRMYFIGDLMPKLQVDHDALVDRVLAAPVTETVSLVENSPAAEFLRRVRLPIVNEHLSIAMTSHTLVATGRHGWLALLERRLRELRAANTSRGTNP